MNSGTRRIVALFVSGILAVVLLVLVQTANTEQVPPDVSDTPVGDFASAPENIASEIFSADVIYDAPLLPSPSSPIMLPDSVWRIGVITDGLYSITYEELAAAGLPVTGTAPADLHLTWRDQDVYLDGTGLGDNSFDAGDSLIFFAEGFQGTVDEEKYTNENVYWLYVDNSSTGPSVSNRDVTPITQLATGVCTATDGIDENVVHFSRWTTEPGTDTAWYYETIPQQTGNALTNTATTTYTNLMNFYINAHDLSVDPQARLDIELASAQSTAHEMMLVMDGENLGEWQWAGKESLVSTVPIPTGVLDAGTNTVSIYFSGDSSVKRSFYLDRLLIHYLQEPTATDGVWLCSTPSTGMQDFTVSNISGSPLLYDVSTALEPVKLTGYTIDGAGLHFSDTLASGTRYIASLPQTLTAADLTYYSPDSDVVSPSTGADEIIIAPQQFHTALQPLIAQRESQGLRVSLVDVEDLYALFNGGVVHPEAIRSFVAWAYNNWPGDAPAYLFLVGDGNYNPLNYNPDGYGDYVPTLIPPYLFFDDPEQGEVPVDVRYGDVVYDQYGKPELSVGRLPANTVTQVEKYVEKVLDYEGLTSSFPSWYNRIILAGDNGASYPEAFETYLSMLDANSIPDVVDTELIYMSELCGYPSSDDCPAATEMLTETWNAGALMLVYSGHGAINRWANEPLIRTSELTALENEQALPFLISLDCFDGLWSYPLKTPYSGAKDLHGMAEWVTTLLTETGTIGAFSPAGLGYASQEYQLAKGLMDSYFIDGERRMGDLADAGRVPIDNTYMARIYTLFGDPAVLLHSYASDKVYMPLTLSEE